MVNKTIGDGGITVDFWIIKVHRLTRIIEYKSILSFEMTLRPSDHERQCQFENIIRSQSSDLNKTFEGEGKIGRILTWNLQTTSNGIKKLPLTVSQLPLILPKLSDRIWSNSISNRSILILPNIPHYIEGAPQNVHTGGGYALHRERFYKSYNPAENIRKQLRTS